MATKKATKTSNQPKTTESPANEIPILENLHLSAIVPSPLNPRKEIDQQAINELAESIEKVGLIQPIVVRKKAGEPGVYELICGERRFLASKIVNERNPKRETIAASIRTLNDAEAMECMITENLQRKDVHPLEEANAFKLMIDHMNYTITDISAKIGKNEPFVNRRLQLINLIPDLKLIFHTGELPIGHAELLSRLEPLDQTLFYNNKFGNSSYNSGAGTLRELKNWLNNNTNKELSKAIFDLSEENLGTIRCIACTNCPNNTSVSNSILFPDSTEEATCTFKACFQDKTKQYFNRELEVALKNPDIIIVCDSYGENEITKSLKAQGYTVYFRYSDYSTLGAIPELKDFTEDIDRDDYETEEDYQHDINSANTQFEAELNEYNENAETYKKAFDVNSGRYIYVQLTEKSRSSNCDSPGVENSRNELVAKIEQKRTRGRELDQEKIMKRLVDHVKELPITKQPTAPDLTPEELNGLIALAFENVGYGERKKSMLEALGLPKDYSDYHKGPETVRAISKASNEARAFVVRLALLNKFSNIAPTSISGGVMFHIAKSWCPEEFDEMVKDQGGVRQRREAKLDSKLKDFDKQNDPAKEAQEQPQPEVQEQEA
ncbi:MAG TPA: ParB/RepB/Spo0J family partition protein [Mucilaginibacter sp.]|jgi:ParB/RepB/Spo0J family partition protein